MSWGRCVWVGCDICEESLNTAGRTVVEARKEVAQDGWTREGKYDVCPRHSEDEVASLLAQGPPGSADRQYTPSAAEKRDCTGVTEMCPVDECGICGMRDCQHGDPMHHHHDGCPSCDTEDQEHP